MSRRNNCNNGNSGNGLLILILIVLQFNCKRERHEHEECMIDNGILFIIALFFLACCGNFNLCCNNC
ncbi:hypothetical protein CLLI_11650 [Clostridium liquoris]|uniref:Uncharacterized protein n=1 Tax=Clostridium liquoris TaxID=1289519 RepID=A0A2T0B5L7_9CLOT|nr:hypothetical protein [Clostridium liquoris]PRR79103.1 hypothetical protein CLLI_11650 [Clostridium liquoris]